MYQNQYVVSLKFTQCYRPNIFLFIYLFILNIIYLLFFIFGCFGSSLLHVGFLQLRQAGATLHRGEWASRCSSFFHCGAWALGMRVSVVVALGLSSCGARALECRLSSCGAWAQLLHGMWDLRAPALEPVSPALAGGFLTTEPPGKSHIFLFKMYKYSFCITYLNINETKFV